LGERHDLLSTGSRRALIDYAHPNRCQGAARRTTAEKIEIARTSNLRGRSNGGRGLALSEIVRMAGLQARPLEDGPSIGTELSAMLMRLAFVLSIELLRPTRRRVLPRLLPPV